MLLVRPLEKHLGYSVLTWPATARRTPAWAEDPFLIGDLGKQSRMLNFHGCGEGLPRSKTGDLLVLLPSSRTLPLEGSGMSR